MEAANLRTAALATAEHAVQLLSPLSTSQNTWDTVIELFLAQVAIVARRYQTETESEIDRMSTCSDPCVGPTSGVYPSSYTLTRAATDPVLQLGPQHVDAASQGAYVACQDPTRPDMHEETQEAPKSECYEQESPYALRDTCSRIQTQVGRLIAAHDSFALHEGSEDTASFRSSCAFSYARKSFPSMASLQECQCLATVLSKVCKPCAGLMLLELHASNQPSPAHRNQLSRQRSCDWRAGRAVSDPPLPKPSLTEVLTDEQPRPKVTIQRHRASTSPAPVLNIERPKRLLAVPSPLRSSLDAMPPHAEIIDSLNATSSGGTPGLTDERFSDTSSASFIATPTPPPVRTGRTPPPLSGVRDWYATSSPMQRPFASSPTPCPSIPEESTHSASSLSPCTFHSLSFFKSCLLKRSRTPVIALQSSSPPNEGIQRSSSYEHGIDIPDSPASSRSFVLSASVIDGSRIPGSPSPLQRMESHGEDVFDAFGTLEAINQMEWEIPHEELVYEERIGKGSYGVVYKGQWHGPVAIKRLNIASHDQQKVEAFRNEVQVLQKTRHINVLLFIGACTVYPELAIVTRWCDGQSLFNHLHLKATPFSVTHIASMGLQISHGMAYLHAKNILHRDLKSANVLLMLPEGFPRKGTPTVQISDFGLATVKTAWNFSQGSGPAGSIMWMAPEVITMAHGDDPYSTKSDVYAFACVMYELFSGHLPYENRVPPEILYLVGRHMLRPNVDLVRDDIPQCLVSLMTRCWTKESEERPAFSEIVESLQRVHDVLPAPSNRKPRHSAGTINARAAAAKEESPKKVVVRPRSSTYSAPARPVLKT